MPFLVPLKVNLVGYNRAGRPQIAAQEAGPGQDRPRGRKRRLGVPTVKTLAQGVNRAGDQRAEPVALLFPLARALPIESRREERIRVPPGPHLREVNPGRLCRLAVTLARCQRPQGRPLRRRQLARRGRFRRLSCSRHTQASHSQTGPQLARRGRPAAR